MTKEVTSAAPAPTSWADRGATKLAAVAILATLALMLAAPNQAGASEGTVVADSYGYVPVYYACFVGPDVGYYDWYSDGYTVDGSITIDSCLMDSLGAGPWDYEMVIAHERGHAAGYGHSYDPYDVMYPHHLVTGT